MGKREEKKQVEIESGTSEAAAANEAARPAPTQPPPALADSEAAAEGPPPTPTPPAAPSGERLSIEIWAEKLGTPKWLFVGARIGNGWPHGQELTEADYRKGIDWAANVPCR